MYTGTSNDEPSGIKIAGICIVEVPSSMSYTWYSETVALSSSTIMGALTYASARNERALTFRYVLGASML